MHQQTKVEANNKKNELALKRIYASAIDWFLGGIFLSFPAVIATSLMIGKGVIFENMYIFEAFGYSRIYTIVIAISCIIFGCSYYLIIPWKIFPQQTIGKKLCKIKIIDFEGNAPKFRQYFIRQCVFLFLIEGISTNAGIFIKPVITLYLQYYVDNYLAILWTITTLASISIMIYGKKGLAFHDVFVRTAVVKV